jgi:Zn-dependent M28 family amino/carboxypeptidase
VDRTTYRNVSAMFGPSGPDRLVVGAHYDAAGPYPGADDNASGVAGLIELAHGLGAAAPARAVELVAYTLEEPPFFTTPQMGSAVHAASLRRQQIRVRAMLSLEMIGYFSDAPNSQLFPHPVLKALYPSTGNFIAVIGKLAQPMLSPRVARAMRRGSVLPVRVLVAPPALPGIDFSDHRSYWQAGYGAVMITDTAFYRNPNYHTPRDRPETLDYRRMASVVQSVQAAVHAL